MLDLKNEFWKIFPTLELQIKLFTELLLGDRKENYYDIEKSAYHFQSLKTKQMMQYQSLRTEFTMQKEKNLFRNGVETRQHVPSADEYADLQVGDTHGSNVSLTQVGDIATAYATKQDSNGKDPLYS